MQGAWGCPRRGPSNPAKGRTMRVSLGFPGLSLSLRSLPAAPGGIRQARGWVDLWGPFLRAAPLSPVCLCPAGQRLLYLSPAQWPGLLRTVSGGRTGSTGSDRRVIAFEQTRPHPEPHPAWLLCPAGHRGQTPAACALFPASWHRSALPALSVSGVQLPPSP